jgi:hypothetical protein
MAGANALLDGDHQECWHRHCEVGRPKRIYRRWPAVATSGGRTSHGNLDVRCRAIMSSPNGSSNAAGGRHRSTRRAPGWAQEANLPAAKRAPRARSSPWSRR